MGKRLKLRFIQCLCLAILLTIVTAIDDRFINIFGMVGVTMSYLLLVVSAAYFCPFFIASSTALVSFLAINYFFVAPRHSFAVAHIESWASLISFLIVSIIISSLVKRLKSQTEQSKLAYQRAEFAKLLAERLVQMVNLEELLNETCVLLQMEFNKSFAIARLDDNNRYIFPTPPLTLPDQNALQWVADNSKPIGPHTGNWPESTYWLIPFSRLPSNLPILTVYPAANTDKPETFSLIKSYVDQISIAYQRLLNNERAKHAELIAQEEAIQSALLASISHDMRTPLTSILGAATALQHSALGADEARQLTSLIESETRYLANTTENILSLIRLESSAAKEIPMDWQSPEEILGIVSSLYKNRGETLLLETTISNPELLIKGNANLLSQALVNLIDNAIKFSQSDRTIVIDVSKSDGYINISVNDRGVGINTKLETIPIKKFSTTSAKGFGLGLSIVQAIAHYHDALFTIKNRDGGGVSAILSFPALEVSDVHA